MGCVFAKPDDGSFAGKDSRHMLARPKCRVLAVIPARFDSERFPGKPLAQVGGKSLVRLTYEAAEGAKCVDYCCVATDDDRVIDAVKSFGGRVVRTSRECADGSERCAQAYRLLVARRAAASRKHLRSDDFDVVVKVECDEAFIRAHHIETAADLVINTDAVVATLVRVSRGPEDDENPDTVKCAMDADGYVTGFTRGAPPPGGMVKVGVTAYRSSFLSREEDRPRRGEKTNGGDGAATRRAEVVDEDAALAAGEKILARQVTEPNLGGLKTQASVDKKNAGIAAGDIRMGGLL